LGKPEKQQAALKRKPEELIYRSGFAPSDLHALLASADTRSLIRRMPPAQFAFAVRELDEEEMAALLPNITEEQWAALLDLSLWKKDRVACSAFFGLHRHLIPAADAVARKILRAADRELWELFFLRELKVYAKLDDDTFEGEPEDRPSMVTPDGYFLLGLPRHTEKAELLRSIIERWYSLEPETISLLILNTRYRTPSELSEAAYLNRKRRIEEWGFPDYYDAIDIYAPLSLRDPLPRKPAPQEGLQNELPSIRPVDKSPTGHLLLFRALAVVEDPKAMESLVEELIHVCNRVLSADRATSGTPAQIRREIRKAVAGINLGLSLWSDDDPVKAADGIQHHFLASFFRIGYGQLIQLRQQAREVLGRVVPEPGSFLESAVEGLLSRYPHVVEKGPKRIHRRYFESAADLKTSYGSLDGLASQPPATEV